MSRKKSSNYSQIPASAEMTTNPMHYEIIPPKKLKPKTVTVPGSKSYTNRALLLAALAPGKSTLQNPLSAEDTTAMIENLKLLGIKIETTHNQLTVHGRGGSFQKPTKTLNIQNAGTAMRFLTATLALQPFKTRITGNSQMQKRPIQPLIQALRQLGAHVQSEKRNGCPPLTIQGPLKGGSAKIPGHLSSQYISALLMITPLLPENTQLQITGQVVSTPYIDMTLQIMKDFGINNIQSPKSPYKNFQILGQQKYLPGNYEIEGDASSAVYFWALSALHGISVCVKNVEYTSQADSRFPFVLKKMGCRISQNTGQLKNKPTGITVTGPKQLTPLEKIDLQEMPDAAMMAIVLSAFTKGKSRFTGLSNLKLKECDRLTALEKNLTALGAQVKKFKDGLEITSNPRNLHGALIETYNDHRIAMCFAIAGTFLPGVKIKNPACVNKTYPDFWKTLHQIGIRTQKSA